MNSNGFSAADMSTAVANGHAEGYQTGYADAVKAVEVGKPAAAQEADMVLIPAESLSEMMRELEGRIGAAKALSDHEEHLMTLIVDAYERVEAAPVAAASVDLDAHGLRALDLCVRDLRRLIELSDDFALDEMQIQSLLTAIESMELRKVASPPATPGIDLEQFRKAVMVYRNFSRSNESEANRLLALIDASPKGGSDSRYFSADPATGEFTTHDTLQAAIDSAESMLSDAGDDAHEAGWTDDPPQICYGVVLGGCIEVAGSRKPAPEGSEFAEYVEFKLQATSAEVGA